MWGKQLLLSDAHVSGYRTLHHRVVPRVALVARRGLVTKAYKEIELPRSNWQGLDLKHVVEAQQFDISSLDVIFKTAREMEELETARAQCDALKGRVIATLFYEPSTRTRLSFESAIVKLGATVLSTESAGEYSSAAKGETLEGMEDPVQLID
jgi:hypothetical protein